MSDEEFGVVTVGSSSCVPVASSLEFDGQSDVRIVFEESPQDPCTAHMASATHVFRFPDEIDQRPVTITLSFGSDYTETLRLP